MLNELEFDTPIALGNFEENYKRKIQSLLEFSPSDASAVAKFKNVKGGYEGILNIAFSQGCFIARAFNSNLNELTKSLFNQIQNQILDWRTSRFLRD